MNTQKSALLKSIEQEIINRDIARALRESAAQLVFGQGNPDADIVFVGEAPGKKEDEQGMPFVGAAGKFLDEMLESISLNRQDVYITNIVKYRPPNNRDPFPEEKQAFLPYLYRQIAVIQPKIIITLGRHSMECFLPGLRISEVHGQVKKIENRLQNTEVSGKDTSYNIQNTKYVLLPLYYPAAALYNGALRQTLLQDFAKIPGIIKSINHESK